MTPTTLPCLALALVLLSPSAAFAQKPAAASAATPDSALYSNMHWREIGPFRGGRTRALAGVPSQPFTFYLGAVNGGVWKTTDAGENWLPLFDAQPTGSIGALAVAPSDPNVIYVASGEGLSRPDLSTGDGVYKSTDAGHTWTHLGLRDGQQMAQVAIDPTNPNRAFFAVVGHPYGPNEERGIFRTLDGGKTYKKVLYVDPNTGGEDVAIDPRNPKIVYASMWQRQELPWENGKGSGTTGGLFKSIDGGDTFTPIKGRGLAPDLVEVNIALAPSDSNRLYITASHPDKSVTLYRSDDAGATWTHPVLNDDRPEHGIGGNGGDLPVPKVDPTNPDIVYLASVVAWRSTDAGRTWSAFRGSPGGDDYQNVWINPTNPAIVALASDQGVTISLNAGTSWSQWYNQPTAQMYHVTTDNHFPYRVCGGQQDSGSACVLSRSDDGRITFHDWHPTGIDEWAYAAPDPLDPEIVFGGKVTRYDRRTGQIANVEPKPLRDGNYRALRTEPLQFSPADPHALFFAANTLWLTRDAGQTWKEVSPDLTRASYPQPASVAFYKDTPAAAVKQRGVIYSLGLSPLSVDRIWAGTDDGLIWTTANGGAHWDNVTPPALQPFWKVFNMDAGHFDAATAYAAVNTLRLDDMRPHLFRTHDAGKSWTEINRGIPDGAATSTIREDPTTRGLLYAGTETQVFVSFNDGDDWHSLRLDMPAVSIRDLTVKGDDLVAGTHGRGFMILDDLTPLRQLTESTRFPAPHLYKPQTALRIRSQMNPPTPWPPEVPAGENPPNGAVIDYVLPASFSGPVALEIHDAAGTLVSRFSSTDPVPPEDTRYPDPLLWARVPRILSAAPGHHRFLWDMHYPALPGVATGPDADQAVPHDTPQVPTSPWVLPGAYTVGLIASGKTSAVPLKVIIDPRVKTPAQDFAQQFQVSKQIYDQTLAATVALHEIANLRAEILKHPPTGPAAPLAAALQQKLDTLAGKDATPDTKNLTTLRDQLVRLEHEMQNADVAPSTSLIEATTETTKPLPALLTKFQSLKFNDLKALNAALKSSHQPQLAPDPNPLTQQLEDAIEMSDEE